MDKQGNQLRESTRLLVRKLGILERAGAGCCGVTLPQCYAVVEIGRKESLSVNELAELLRLDKSTVSKTVDKLVTGGLLARKPDRDDRRYVVLALTEQGHALYSDIEARMEEQFAATLSVIPAEKRAQVIESLTLLADALQMVER